MDRRQRGLLQHVLVMGVLSLLACSAKPSGSDGGTGGDAGQHDAGIPDAGHHDGGMDAGMPDSGPPPMASFRVVHAVADAVGTKFDVYAKSTSASTLVASNVAYNGASDYVQVTPGFYSLELRTAGSPATDAPRLTTPPVKLAADVSTTFIAAGLFTSLAGDDSDTARIVVVKDKFDPPDDSETTIKIVNASPDAPAFAVAAGGDGSFNVPPVARFTASAGNGYIVPDSLFGFRLGTGNPPLQVSAGFPPISTTGQLWAYVIVTGLYNVKEQKASSLSLVVLPLSGAPQVLHQNPTFYALNLTDDQTLLDGFFTTWSDAPADAGMPPDAGAADAGDMDAGTADAGSGMVNKSPPGKLLPRFTQGQLAGPVSLNPTDHMQIDFYPHTEGLNPPDGAPLYTVMVDKVAAQQNYLIVLSGSAAPGSTTPLTLKMLQESFDVNGNAQHQALVRVYNAAGTWGSLNIGPTSNGQLSSTYFSNVGYANDTGASGMPIDPKAIDLGIAQAPSMTPDLVYSVTFQPDQTLFLIPADDGMLAPPQTLLLIDTTLPRWTMKQLAPE